MIDEIKYTGYNGVFFKNEKFTFKDITLLVGDQGAGKSTILKDLKKLNDLPPSYMDISHRDGVLNGILYFDAEKDNPRFQQANPFSGDEVLSSALSQFRSHGELMIPIWQQIQNLTNSLILLDEPETALSLRNQYKLIDIFNTMLENGNQIIAATHNLLLMQSFPDNILSVEDKRYMKPENFIKAQKKPETKITKREDKRIKFEHCKMGLDCKCAEESGRYKRSCENSVNYRKRRR
jgi:predicted ATPase